MKLLLLLVAMTAGLLGADLDGKWEFVWQTPDGERRTAVTLKQNADSVDAQFPDAKEPITGTFRGGKLSLSGLLYSAEAGEAANFKLNGELSDGQLKGTGAWGEYEMTFTARKAN